MPAANGIYKLAVIGRVFSNQHIHTLHFRSTVDPDSLAMTEDAWQAGLVDAWQGAPATAYRLMFHADQSPVQDFQVRKVCGSIPLPAGLDEAQTTGQTSGTAATTGDFAVQNVAPWLAQVVTERTAFAGRRYRGRFFLGGLHESQVDGESISAPRTALVQAYCNALVAAFITPADLDTPYRLFVYSRTIALDPEMAGTPCQNTGADVRSLQVRSPLATMKSRKTGSGI